MTLSIAESLLPQPPSFQKKKAYAIHKVLGVGTFGKVMVSPFPSRSPVTSISVGRVVLECALILTMLCF